MTRKKENISVPAFTLAAIPLAALMFIILSASNVRAQNSPDAIMGSKQSGPAPVMKKLGGEIRVQKSFGVIPMGPGNSQAAPMPCGQFSIAVYDANTIKDKKPPIAKA